MILDAVAEDSAHARDAWVWYRRAKRRHALQQQNDPLDLLRDLIGDGRAIFPPSRFRRRDLLRRSSCEDDGENAALHRGKVPLRS